MSSMKIEKFQTIDQLYKAYLKRTDLPNFGGFEELIYYSGILDAALAIMKGIKPYEIINECAAKGECMALITKTQLKSRGVKLS